MKKSKFIKELYAQEKELYEKIKRSSNYNKLFIVQSMIVQHDKKTKKPLLDLSEDEFES